MCSWHMRFVIKGALSSDGCDIQQLGRWVITLLTQYHIHVPMG